MRVNFRASSPHSDPDDSEPESAPAPVRSSSRSPAGSSSPYADIKNVFSYVKTVKKSVKAQERHVVKADECITKALTLILAIHKTLGKGRYNRRRGADEMDELIDLLRSVLDSVTEITKGHLCPVPGCHSSWSKGNSVNGHTRSKKDDAHDTWRRGCSE